MGSRVFPSAVSTRGEAVSFVEHCIHLFSGSDDGAERQGLLPCSNLSDVVCCRRRFLGNKCSAVSFVALDPCGRTRAGATDGNSVRSIGAADSPAGKNCAIYEGARPAGDANGNEYDRGTSPTLC